MLQSINNYRMYRSCPEEKHLMLMTFKRSRRTGKMNRAFIYTTVDMIVMKRVINGDDKPSNGGLESGQR